MERTCDATVPMPKTIYILVDGNHGGKENVAPSSQRNRTLEQANLKKIDGEGFLSRSVVVCICVCFGGCSSVRRCGRTEGVGMS
jgi:hypothetical protein